MAVPLVAEAEARRWSIVWRRSRYGWSKWLEIYRRDELIYELATRFIEDLVGFGVARRLAPYLRVLSEHAVVIRGRGGDPRALASAAAYYCLVWRSSLEGWGAGVVLRDFFRYSSRASLYRSLRILVTGCLGHGELFYRALLRGGLRTASYSIYKDGRIYVRRGLVVLRRPNLKVYRESVVRGVLRVPGGCFVEAYCLPPHASVTGEDMATVELKMRFRVLELLELLRRKLGESFTAKDVADILATDSRYAGRMLRLLEKKGYLEIVDEKPVRRYRIRNRAG